MKLLTNLDLSKNQLLNSVLQNLTQAPSSAEMGQIYYNTQDKRAYIYTGSVWLAMDAKDASQSAESIVNTINSGNSNIQIGKIENLANQLSQKETPDSAQQKVNTALQQAKDYAKAEIAKVVGGASEQYDTLKEIEQILKSSQNVGEILNELRTRPKKFTKDIGNNSATSFLIQHNLNTQDITVTLREKESPFSIVYTDVEITDENNITVKFAKKPEVNQYKVIIIG